MKSLLTVWMFCLVCGGEGAASVAARAQSVAQKTESPVAARSKLRSLVVDAQNLDDLRALPPSREVWNRAASTWRRAPNDLDIVSLDCSRRDLEAQPLALQALARWTSAGGVVLLHTDAAQLFGFQTVRAREGTPQLAGQMFGRARAALPFAAHPLLAAQEPVGMVFYRLQPNDALVTDSPNGVPLLRVTDLPLLSTGAPNSSSYAAAMAPFGRGWAVFVPRIVETHRADGATFATNLQRFARNASPDGKRAPDGIIGVPSSLITGASDALRAALLPTRARASSNAENTSDAPTPSIAPATMQKALMASNTPAVEAGLASLLEIAPQIAPEGQGMPKVPVTGAQVAREMLAQSAASETSLLLSRGEAAAAWSLSHAINTAVALRNTPPNLAAGEKPQAVPTMAQEAAWRAKLAALLLVWRGRLEWQQARSDARDKEADKRAEIATGWLQLASQIVPNASEVGLWRGIIARGRAGDITLASPERAEILNQAVVAWRAALTNQPLVPDDFALQAVEAATQAAIAAQIAYDAELDKARAASNR